MTLLPVNEVGIFRCKYFGMKQCKNPNYHTMTLGFEISLYGDIKDWSTIPNKKYLLIDAEKLTKFKSMMEGRIYNIKMACKFQPERNKNGRSYPAGISYEPLEVLGEAKIQDIHTN